MRFNYSFRPYYIGQYADNIVFKMTYLIGNFKFTCICLIYAGYVSFLLVHSKVIRDFSFEDNGKKPILNKLLHYHVAKES